MGLPFARALALASPAAGMLGTWAAAFTSCVYPAFLLTIPRAPWLEPQSSYSVISQGRESTQPLPLVLSLWAQTHPTQSLSYPSHHQNSLNFQTPTHPSKPLVKSYSFSEALLETFTTARGYEINPVMVQPLNKALQMLCYFQMEQSQAGHWWRTCSVQVK